MKTIQYKIKALTATPGLQKILVVVLFAFCSSCEDLLDVGTPKNQIITKSVYTDNKTATSAIIGIYSKMIENTSVITNAAIQGGLSSDELASANSNTLNLEFFNNNVLIANSAVLTYWRQAYQYIYYCNTMLEGLAESTGIDASVKSQLEGEAKLIRGLIYFHLLNLFGDVPLILVTDYTITSKASRTPKAEVIGHVIDDLEDSRLLLNADYPAGFEAKTRPNKITAVALLARVYLYKGDWSNAETLASEVINSSKYTLEGLSSTFLASSKETIWQLRPVRPNLNSNLGNIFVLTGSPNSVYLSNQFIAAFEPGDARRTNWVAARQVGTTTYNYPNKYKLRTGATVTEFNIMLRLGEQYLIRSEARAKQDNLIGSREDLTLIRQRAGLSPAAAESQSELLAAIERERRIELFSEEGNHRWYDLKRTNRADAVLGSTKPAWQPGDELYPIPQLELLNNLNLLPQNNGY